MSSRAVSTGAAVGIALIIVVVAFSSLYFGQNYIKGASTVTENQGTTQNLNQQTTQSTSQTASTTTSSSNTDNEFGSNAQPITLTSANLYGGTEASALGVPASGATYVTFALENPSSTSSITGISLTGAGITAVTLWETASGTAYSTSPNNELYGGQVNSFTFYSYGTAQSITTGQTFNYVISFANGQSVSGSLIAQ